MESAPGGPKRFPRERIFFYPSFVSSSSNANDTTLAIIFHNVVCKNGGINAHTHSHKKKTQLTAVLLRILPHPFITFFLLFHRQELFPNHK